MLKIHNRRKELQAQSEEPGNVTRVPSEAIEEITATFGDIEKQLLQLMNPKEYDYSYDYGDDYDKIHLGEEESTGGPARTTGTTGSTGSTTTTTTTGTTGTTGATGTTGTTESTSEGSKSFDELEREIWEMFNPGFELTNATEAQDSGFDELENEVGGTTLCPAAKLELKKQRERYNELMQKLKALEAEVVADVDAEDANLLENIQQGEFGFVLFCAVRR